ncbi:MAG TPA: PAS domain S-box protein, partial [Gammaproteobacteria bacterium]|nr:PAS domain S-box protein [Gammaproteobacteria bacterium]
MSTETFSAETTELVSETGALLSALPDLIFRLDRQGTFLDVKQSPHIPLLLAPEAFLGHNIRDVTPPHLAEGTLKGIEETRRTGQPAIFHYQLEFDGERRDFEARIVRIGTSEEYLSIVRDVTDHQQALRQARDNETRYRALFELANDAVFLVRDGRIIDCNGKALEMFCCRKHELLGKTPIDISPPKQPNGRPSAEQAMAVMQRAMAGEPQRFEWQHRRFDGTLFDCEISVGRIDLPDGPLIQAIVHDITRRRLAQRALEESNRLLEQVFANDFIEMAYLDRDFRFIRVNPAFARAFGRRPDDFIGRNFFDDCKDPGNRERFARVVDEGRPHIEKARVEQLDEDDPERHYWDWSLQPVKDRHGQVTGLVFVRMDVTDRLRNEQRLQQAAKELDMILHNMQDTYYRIDANGILTRVSDSVKDLLGYEPQEVIGRPMVEFYLHPEEREAFLRKLELAGGSITNNETALRHRDGSVVWTSSNAHFIRDEQGNVIGVEGTARNITERKLHESQVSKLSSVLEQTADIVIVTDIDGVIEYVNPSFERVTGYTYAEAVGQTPTILSSGKHKPEFYQHMWETILSGESYTNIMINRRKDGSLYYEEKTITPIRD